MKLEKLVLVGAVLLLLGYVIYKGVNHMRWLEANCDKEYYKVETQVCVKTKKSWLWTGKSMMPVTRCVEYKDTLVTQWKYKCPKNLK